MEESRRRLRRGQTVAFFAFFAEDELVLLIKFDGGVSTKCCGAASKVAGQVENADD
jgi:hypothetical protein